VEWIDRPVSGCDRQMWRHRDVCAAVRFARRLGMPLAVRSGGHSFPGLSACDDGIVVDLHMMCEIQVDPGHSTARAQGGVFLEELDAATQEHGLAVPSGIVTPHRSCRPDARRRHRLADAQVRSHHRPADVRGLGDRRCQVVTASETQNADLFLGAPRCGGNWFKGVDRSEVSKVSGRLTCRVTAAHSTS
jgi:hypothetical protein